MVQPSKATPPAKRAAPVRPSSSPEKPAEWAGPEFAREIDLTVKEETNKADAQPHGQSEHNHAKRDRQCVVGPCKQPKVPGSKICSGHEIAFHRDGTPRATGPNKHAGMVAQAAVEGYHRANGERIDL
jgi:hypothetical protein